VFYEYQNHDTADLAQSITWAGSKQTYYIARLMVDNDLVNDFLRAYAYFRWADDIIDAPGSKRNGSRSNEEGIRFVKRQRSLIEGLYKGEQPDDLAPEEEIVAVLISHDRGENSGLQSFILNMFAVIEFDANRRGRPVSQSELIWYTEVLSKAVTDGLQYFVGNYYSYPDTEGRYLAAKGAHITHQLRDFLSDNADGFINIPSDYLEANSLQHGIGIKDVESALFRSWVRSQVEHARKLFREGKQYLDELNILRCKIVGHWYCARFELILDAIERDDYVLCAEYNERRKPSTWLKFAWLSLVITIKHFSRRSLLQK